MIRRAGIAIFSLVAFCGGLALPAIAQDQTSDLQTSLESTLAELREKHDLPAIAGAIVLDGKTVAIDAQGVRQIGSDSQVTVDDRWHLGSITKSMTSTLAARLIEQDRMDWSSTLSELLPEMAEEMYPQWRDVTVEQLMTHTAGAPGNFSPFLQWSRPDTPEAMVEKRRETVAGILEKEPKSEPGTAYAYSNVGYTILGHAIENLLDTSWEEAMRTEVFEPLGLDSAGFGPPRGDNPWGHGSFFGFRGARNPDSNNADNTPVMGPAGIVHMALDDLVAYGDLHLRGEQGEETSYLSTETFQRLHQPALDDYAKGWVYWQRDWAGNGGEEGPAIWHNGSNTMWYALLVLLPEKDAVIALVTNDASSLNAVQSDFFGAVASIATDLPQNAAMETE